ncbi:hypothetical protein QUF76_01710 [Desulfobacterales bacterium HSG16]|nr:hypothetical protein [Desulfobacterales bacterium HSG16]
MTTIIADHIKGSEIPSSWVRAIEIDPGETFRVILEPEKGLTKKERHQLLDMLERFDGYEDSEAWIREIKSARTRSELKVPLC